MIRNLKALGLALVAVLAMSAMAASAASANNDVFTVGNGKPSALLTGVGHTDVFKITPNNKFFECTLSKFAGTVLNNATTATVDAEYSKTINMTPHPVTRTTATRRSAP